LGEAFASQFAERGFDLILVARRASLLEKLAHQLERKHRITATSIAGDLSKKDTPRAIFEEVNKLGLHVDILVNNAGILEFGPFAEAKLEDINHLIQLDLVALTNLTHLFLQPMIARKKGRILNVASFAAFMPAPNLAVYAAVKGYVLLFSEALLEEVHKYGISVTALCPGHTRTGAMEQAKGFRQAPSFMSLDAHTVAKEGIEACLKGEAYHIPGAANRAFVYMGKMQPRWLVRRLMNFISE